MRKQEEFEVNGSKYLVTQFGAKQGVKLGKKVAKVALPAIAAVYGNEASSEYAIPVMMEVVSENLDYLDEDTIQELLSLTTKNNYAINFDDEFAGNYLTLFKLLWEIVQFNFADFFQLAQGGTDQADQ
jgi:hypothetical protein